MDFVEVAGDQLSLCVHFFGQVPEGVTTDNVRIDGGRRIRDITVVKVEIEYSQDPELDDCLRISLDKFGDFSTYRLCLVERVTAPDETEETEGETAYRPLSGIDPRYACIDFSFKVDCPSDIDCAANPGCPPEVFPAPEINYLAKDYASFRQLILDRLAVIMPGWTERHVPDVGMTLVELLAYVGDHLSYYQDAVATEAYLDTARQRISVRRHARLVDYRMHEGSNARAWVTVWTRTDLPPLAPNAFYFITGFTGLEAASAGIVRAADLELVARDRYDVFEPLVSEPDEPVTFRAGHSEIHFYTWGDNECCIEQGATRATMLDEGEHPEPEASPQRILQLEPGDVLIFEEVLGPTTGNAADADPAKRHPVRLTTVTRAYDALLDKRVVEIEWALEDALPFSLCLSARLPAPDCRWIHDVSVARGNVILVDHGRTVAEPFGPVGCRDILGECACDGAVIETASVPERFRPTLGYAPLTFAQPVLAQAPATVTISQDVRLALPTLSLAEYQTGDDEQATGATWAAQYDLLASGSDDRHFVVEVDDDLFGHVRFGDGDLGRLPSSGTSFQAVYRVGNGPAGNVGRETISYLVLREGTLSADEVKPRNPLAAEGGTPAEPTAHAKLCAPYAVRHPRLRAITADDYAEIAQQDPGVQRAACELRWTGSWYEARVAIDPLSSAIADAALLNEIEGHLYKFRRMGHDLALVPARYVPLDVGLDICVLADFARGQVRAELLQVLGNRPLVDGRLGFFHPDDLSFGTGIYLSRLVATAMTVEGVETVKVTRLKRLHEPDGGALDTGVLTFGAMEIAALDNDPDFPENGRLELTMRGGR